MRVPLFEVVDRMQLTNMAIELAVQGAYSKGGVPLNVTAIANIKIPSEEPLLHNAIERFLGYAQQQIMLIAKDTLEANLRGVIAELTPEEINQKKVVFQQKLIEEADRDLSASGWCSTTCRSRTSPTTSGTSRRSGACAGRRCGATRRSARCARGRRRSCRRRRTR